jgi:RNA polymerase sigma-70 factor (ECF subfamily)
MTTSLNQPAILSATDDQLISFLKTDDERQFARLYEHFSASVFGILQRWIKNTETAENLLQDVFVKAWRCRHLYEEEKGRIFTWLYRITKNICIDYFRSKACKKDRLSVYGEDIPELLNKANEASDIIPDAIGLRKLVNMLRDEEREVVNMMYFNGMTQRQVAEAMDIPLGTVKTRMNKAIKELRYYYKNDWRRAAKIISLN